MNRIFGGPGGRPGLLPEAVVAVSERAGKPVWIPDDVAGTCCATIWHSKGYDAGNRLMANRIVEAAWGGPPAGGCRWWSTPPRARWASHTRSSRT